MAKRVLRLCARNHPLRVIGLMSGTSADGVDAAMVDVRAAGVDVLAFRTYPYARPIREAILAACHRQTGRVDDICRLNFAMGEVFAGAALRLLRQAGVSPRDVDLIGSHGQTIHHLPGGSGPGRHTGGSTLQIGEPSVIAERTGITTVADFRPRDIAAGGQGAPLVPLADFLLFRHARRTRAVQNIGGIANVTILPAACDESGVIAFDTGPGNMILDRLAYRLTAGRLTYDRGGRLAGGGRVHRPTLSRLMRRPFLRKRPPRTTGREEFGAPFADALLERATREGVSPRDLMATAAAFTAACIADSYARFSPRAIDEVILCGGGSRNPVLVAMLTAMLAPASVALTDDFGIDADAKEAVSFAILAARTARGLPGNIPSATGARRAAVLGKIVPGL
jgi:anhydro-N-acetylmuramic acid kinase